MSNNEIWRQAVEWLIACKVLEQHNTLTAAEAEAKDLAFALRDGVVLCNLAHKLYNRSLDYTKICKKTTMSQFYCIENIKLFLDACVRIFNMKPENLFEPEELYNFTNFSKVLSVLSQMSHSEICKRFNIEPFPRTYRCNSAFIHDNEEEVYRKLVDEADKDYDDENKIYDVGPQKIEEEDVGGSNVDQIYDSLFCHKNFNDEIYTSKYDKWKQFIPKEQKDHVIKEILDTEIHFTNEVLTNIINYFYLPLRNDLTHDEHTKVFSNMADIQKLHAGFLVELEKAVYLTTGIDKRKTLDLHRKRIGDVFVDFKFQFLKHYKVYIINSMNSREFLSILETSRSDIREKIKEYSKKSRTPQFRLQDLLCIPAQRIMKYHLLLKDLLKKISLNDVLERESIEKSIEASEDINEYLNEAKRDFENRVELKKIYDSIYDMAFGDKIDFIDYGRQVKDGEVKFADSRESGKLKNRHVFVFDKIMLVCKAQRYNTFTYKTCYLLSNYKVIDDLEPQGKMNTLSRKFNTTSGLSFYLIENGYTINNKSDDCNDHNTTSSVNYIQICCKSLNQREQWMRSIIQAQENVCPKKAIENGHIIEYKTFKDIVTCSFCDKFLKGLYYQGYKCECCELIFHRECLMNNRKCPGRPKSFINNNAGFARRQTFSGSLGEIVTAITTTTSPDPHVLNFKENDKIEVVEIKNDGLFVGRLVTRPNKMGLVHPTTVKKCKIMPSNISRASSLQISNFNTPPSTHRRQQSSQSILNGRKQSTNNLEMTGHEYYKEIWYVGTIDREKARDKLVNCQEGTFLVRWSNNQKKYVISLKTEDHVKHMIVENISRNVVCLCNSRVFGNLKELIEFYKVNSLSECFTGLYTTLKTPLLKTKLYRVTQNFDREHCPEFDFTDSRFLSMSQGDIVTLVDLIGEEKYWWMGEINGRVGFFPIQYVSEVVDGEKKDEEVGTESDEGTFSMSSMQNDIPTMID
uniref:Protein vav (inferred by orthology to a D. melanogaster protein) n=1 Tax=Strongyloides venezuelensis TaxID=75913 RepID=A0A0K0FCY2_STRVS